MAEHGTRTMYVHYGCRCEACCKAEHQQYLKRAEAKKRMRTHSKWGTDEDVLCLPKSERAKVYFANRYKALKDRPSTHTHFIRWQELADTYEMKCAICGCDVNPNDKWRGKAGRMCYGRTYPSVDHIIPLSRGGTDTLDNVQLVCRHCNSVKGAKYDTQQAE